MATSRCSVLPTRHLQCKNINIDDVMGNVGKRLCESKEEVRHDIFRNNIANKFRALPDQQRIFLEK